MPNSTTLAHDVFISYSTIDKPTADAVCATLEANGIRCWVAPRDIVPGSDWGGSIVEAINRSQVMVLVFSSHSNRSVQVKREVERAVNKGIAIIPLRIENVLPSKALEYFISSQHWLDALTPPLEGHLRHLTKTIRVILSREPEATRPSTPRPIPPPASSPICPAAPTQPPGALSGLRLKDSGGWHWPAFCLGPIWYLSKGMISKGIWLLVLTLGTAFLAAPFVWFYCGSKGKGDWYDRRLKEKSRFDLETL